MCRLNWRKTSCLYGGVTIHDGNQLDEERVIGVNVFKDGVQQEGFVIKTKKAKVTVQELDTKVRFKLENLYKIYNKDTGNIQKGCIFFHSHNHQDQSFYYDLYNVKGSVGAEFFNFIVIIEQLAHLIIILMYFYIKIKWLMIINWIMKLNHYMRGKWFEL